MVKKSVEITDCCFCPHFNKWTGKAGGFGNNVRVYTNCGLTGSKLPYSYEENLNLGFPSSCPLKDVPE